MRTERALFSSPLPLSAFAPCSPFDVACSLPLPTTNRDHHGSSDTLTLHILDTYYR